MWNREKLGVGRYCGATIIYAQVMLTVMLLMASLAVDYGRVQLAKLQLEQAADAAARFGAQGVANNSTVANAIAVAAENKVDGATLVLQPGDVTVGYWSGGTFTTSGGGTPAVRVIARRAQSRGTGIPVLFAAILGQRNIDITAESIATYTAPVSSTANAPAQGNPWLAGMPNGTTANSFDSAPANSPKLITGLPITQGGTLTFDFSGSASYLPGKGAFGPDGNLLRMIYNGYYSGFITGREHGMSNLTAPITSVVGVFLDAQRPDQAGSPPDDLDFSSDASRDFSTLSPQLRQPFFIGDGLRADGVTQQRFVVPAGATRLFIGVMDGQQWSDNAGSFSTAISTPAAIALVE